jgi:sugar lactone lactonase YvrE
MKIEHVLSCQDQLGEGPLWSMREAALYWVDAFGRRYHRYDPLTGIDRLTVTGEFTITLALTTSGGPLVVTDSRIIDNRGAVLEVGPFDYAAVRFNDGRVSPRGSLFIGSMHRTETTPLGSLFRINQDGLELLQPEVITSNGLGWSPDQTVFYYTDSIRKMIWKYRYDGETDCIMDRSVFVDSSSEPGVPDGLCVDAEGCVWSARWNGWNITRYDPDGRSIQRIETPVAKPTSCAFGGSALSDLYITSARVDLSPEHLRDYPLSGDLFLVRTDTQGQTENVFLSAP